MAHDEEMKIRVPAKMKADFQALAAAKLTSESAVAREALLEYLKNHQEELKEAAPPYPAGGTSPVPTGKPVTYRKGTKKGTRRKILDTVREKLNQDKPSQSQQK